MDTATSKARKKLVSLFAEDQRIRQLIGTSTDKTQIKLEMRRADAHNTAKLKELIDLYSLEALAIDGGNELWHLIQHSDHDVEFQKQALGIFQQAQKISITAWQIAFLEDRIAMNEGRPQKYGSQLTKNKQTKSWVPYTVQELDMVDKYRSQVGLGTLDAYVNEMNA